ncbi:9366_t:CDS:1 [Dentiscutata erythropus]|uniref:9366_t:CDS:1 n=1 Tax=Dentiscutata erythropus TaxID=1348616 RepID=A0A9N9D8V1_9GLOM|nr:9366_t:CDS:1 [Dentiscutata erythropus]
MSFRKSSFSYQNDNINVLHIGHNVEARIERIDENFASIYFVDDHGLQVPPPSNSVLRDTTTNRNVLYRRNEFLISWICNYSFLQNGSEIFRLERQKQHAISGEPSSRTSYMISEFYIFLLFPNLQFDRCLVGI